MPGWLEVPQGNAPTCGSCGMILRGVFRRNCEHFPEQTFLALENRSNYYPTMVYAESVVTCPCGCNSPIVNPAESARTVPGYVPGYVPESGWSCEWCEDHHEGTAPFIIRDAARRTLHAACEGCYELQTIECRGCGTRVHSDDVQTVEVDGDDEEMCRDCARDYIACMHCGRTYHRENDSCCDSDSDDDGIVAGCDCAMCEERSQEAIHSYSYKPIPDFRAIGPEVIERSRKNRYGEEFVYDATVYMGLELEVEVSGSIASAAREIGQGLGDVAYLKSDSSIGHGFEIVTHPMTLEYAMAKFNWSTLRAGRKGRTIYPSASCGLHIHASRASFSSPAHEYRWLLFWYRNADVMQALAGRHDNSYASFTSDQRRELTAIVKGSARWTERYSAINTNNEHTFEVRAFASTLYVNRLKAALQLVESTIEYTRRLAASKVLSDGGFSWSEYVSWLQLNRSRYADLLERIASEVTGKIVVETARRKEMFMGQAWTGRYERWGDQEMAPVYRQMITQEKVGI